jgi:hypothetical protein
MYRPKSQHPWRLDEEGMRCMQNVYNLKDLKNDKQEYSTHGVSACEGR